MTYDLIVIGAGPAGCAASITAARSGAHVLLMERGRFPRHRVCGEFVSAESLGLLENLLAPACRELISRSPRIAKARIFADGAEVHAEIAPAAAGITRFDLDDALWNSCRASGVELRDECSAQDVQRISTPKGEAVFSVKTQQETFEAKAVINAAGRWSFLSSFETRARASKDRWIGVKCHFYEQGASPSVDLYFFDGGYCGVQPVRASNGNGGNTVVNACAMVRAEVATDLQAVLRCHPSLQLRSASWHPVIEPVSTSPLVFHEPEPVRDGMLQVGDAATFVDPFVGDGISLAIRGGALAAQCLQKFFRNECSLEQATEEYSRAYQKRLAGVFRASSRIRSLLQWPTLIRRPAMSILQRSPFIARQLVRMTR